jgi:hypothetical protein
MKSNMKKLMGFSVLLVALQSASLVASGNEVCAGPFTGPAYSEVLGAFDSENAR